MDIIKRKLVRGDGTDALDGLRRAGVFHAKRVGVFTVDGYQGREADVVIVSLVSYTSGSIRCVTRYVNGPMTKFVDSDQFLRGPNYM